MKLLPVLFLSLSLLTAAAFSQTPTPPSAVPSEPKIGLTKFDLDFPGGTPGELVAAIQKAMGRPLNAIIPEEHANRQLPPLKMSRVDVAQLFDALVQASIRDEAVGGMQWGSKVGFYTSNPAKLSDETVWFFRVQGAPNGWQEQLKICRVYSLTSYLDGGLTVDDITTAIQTAWRMLGEPMVPRALTFHQETKLLIVVADVRSLETIDAVLKALPKPTPGIINPAPVSPSDEKKSKS